MSDGWTVAGGRLVRPAPFCLAGIVNLTPDSFFDGGLHDEADQAVRHGLRLLDEGARVLDLGAESTRPGASPLGDTLERSCAVETARLLPALESLRRLRPEAVLCVDTCHGATAAAALAAGADAINDVSACGRDPSLLEVLAQHQPGYVLMHGSDKAGAEGFGDPGTVTERALRFFDGQLARLVRAGLPENRIVLDPGVGFGKSAWESAALLRDAKRLQSLGRPLYVGVSMKSLFGDLLDLPLADRGEATRVAVALLAARGVRYHRVHDVANAVRALRLVSLVCPEAA